MLLWTSLNFFAAQDTPGAESGVRDGEVINKPRGSQSDTMNPGSVSRALSVNWGPVIISAAWVTILLTNQRAVWGLTAIGRLGRACYYSTTNCPAYPLYCLIVMRGLLWWNQFSSINCILPESHSWIRISETKSGVCGLVKLNIIAEAAKCFSGLQIDCTGGHIQMQKWINFCLTFRFSY